VVSSSCFLPQDAAVSSIRAASVTARNLFMSLSFLS
jgi:hypothetical protein